MMLFTNFATGCGERYAKRQLEELIRKYEKFSMLSSLQYLGEVRNNKNKIMAVILSC